MKPFHPAAFRTLLDVMIARVDPLLVAVLGGEASIRQIESFLVDAKDAFIAISDSDPGRTCPLPRDGEWRVYVWMQGERPCFMPPVFHTKAEAVEFATKVCGDRVFLGDWPVTYAQVWDSHGPTGWSGTRN